MTPESREILKKWLDDGDHWLVDEFAVGTALRWHTLEGSEVVTKRIKPEEFYQMSFDREKTNRLAALWALERAETILSNMALENTGWWASLFSRWAISDEPLRGDARNALPEIRRAIERLQEENRKT